MHGSCELAEFQDSAPENGQKGGVESGIPQRGTHVGEGEGGLAHGSQASVCADGLGMRLRVDDGGAKRWVLRLTIHGRRRDVRMASGGDCFWLWS